MPKGSELHFQMAKKFMKKAQHRLYAAYKVTERTKTTFRSKNIVLTDEPSSISANGDSIQHLDSSRVKLQDADETSHNIPG